MDGTNKGTKSLHSSKNHCSDKHICLDSHDHCCGTSLIDELAAHFPYAVLAVAFSMVILGVFYSFNAFSLAVNSEHRLFHIFHYMHLLFAGTGTVLSFRRYSKSIIGSILAGLFIPAFFCTFSDAILPYFGGMALGLDMYFHWCFVDHLNMVLPFLLTGIINGWVLSTYSSDRHVAYSIKFHFLHIAASAMASLLYFAGFGFSDWMSSMGTTFLLMLFVVLLPCSLSDIVIPIWFAKKGK